MKECDYVASATQGLIVALNVPSATIEKGLEKVSITALICRSFQPTLA
jgi:hypothetical protein